MAKEPTRLEQAIGSVLIVGALLFGARACMNLWAAPDEPEPAADPCADAAAGRQRVADREFDLAQGIRNGKLSASEVREAAAALEQRRYYAARDEAACEALTNPRPEQQPAARVR